MPSAPSSGPLLLRFEIMVESLPPYDIESAATKIFNSNLERNFGHRLFIGV